MNDLPRGGHSLAAPSHPSAWNAVASLMLVAALLLVADSGLAAPVPTESAVAPAFSLKRWDGSGDIRLADFAGKIVVLDFFAYWCLPCQRASREIEDKVRAHYASASGNRHGVPVEVLSVNVEADQRARTEAFIKRHRLTQVVEDREGATLAAFGGKNLPYVVVIDGTAATSDRPDFRIVYRKEGFEGAVRLRAVIDELGQDRPRASRIADDDETFIAARLRAGLAAGDWPFLALTEPMATPARDGEDGTVAPDAGQTGLWREEGPSRETGAEDASLPWTRKPSLAFDGLFASDIALTLTSVGYGISRGPWEANVAAGFSTYGLDYQPVSFDFLGAPTRVEEARGFGQVSGRWRLAERLTLSAGAGLYDGFTDYRSVWLAEYYRQQFAGLPGYAEPSPAGHHLSGGARWEYLPSSGFVQLDYTYLSDEIAPGYEIDFDGLRSGRPYLYTHLFQLSFENLVGRRVRVRHELRRVDTSDRDVRIGYQGSLNAALGERWVVRIQGGAAAEEPNFDAWYVGGTVEYELSPSWLLSVSGRYYEDSGEIENSNFSNAAPELQAWQAGLGVRYARGAYSARLFVAPYATRYGAFGIGTAFFQNLYKDRDWGLVQAAVAAEF